MATKRIVSEELIDDLDGGKAEGTVRFGWYGTEYELDLSKRNRSAMEKAVKPYLDAARTVRKTRPTRKAAGRSRSSAGKRDLGAVRDWARSNGFEVSERGRISSVVIQAYEAAQD
jgi:hypothetical protein